MKIDAVLAICEVLEEADDDVDVGNGGHGGNDGCCALVKVDEPMVKVDKSAASAEKRQSGRPSHSLWHQCRICWKISLHTKRLAFSHKLFSNYIQT